MNKNYLLLFLVIILAVSLVSLVSITTLAIFRPQEKLIMGYCPTMEPYALEFSEEFELIKLSNTAEVLKNLNKGLIDVGLVG